MFMFIFYIYNVRIGTYHSLGEGVRGSGRFSIVYAARSGDLELAMGLALSSFCGIGL